MTRWTRAEWVSAAADLRPTLERGIGWDVTDFGSADFDRIGLTLFTYRNGTLAEQASGRGQTYAEKLMVASDGQGNPFHYHRTKTEDIINQGGGEMLVELFDGEAPEAPVSTFVSGILTDVQPRTAVRLRPGDSIQVPAGVYHRWVAEGAVVGTEVSSVNDDHADNVWLDQSGRFPGIEEDVEARFILVGEYPALLA